MVLMASGDRGIEMMFVGYPANRESGSFRTWDPLTNGVATTRDVIWMKRMVYDWPNDAFFDIECSPPDAEAKDVDEVIGTNDGTAIVDAVRTNDESQQSTQVQWADPIAPTSVIKPEARRLSLKLLQ